MFDSNFVKTILAPFVGKKLRMISDSIPFLLETSIESSFQIQLTPIGIQFILIDNFEIKKLIRATLAESLNEISLYPGRIDELLLKKEERNPEKNIVFDSLVEKLAHKVTPQIAFTYYTMIKSICVEENKFILNGTKFVIER